MSLHYGPEWTWDWNWPEAIAARREVQEAYKKSFCSSTFHSRTRAPFEPPQSAVIVSSRAWG